MKREREREAETDILRRDKNMPQLLLEEFYVFKPLFCTSREKVW